jgi:hypothetical protein
MTHDVIIVGAGVAGLTLARALREAGLSTVVLERSRGVGGRCATRRVEGQPVDHGVAFLHGRDPRFVDDLEAAAEGTPVRGWPLLVDGQGMPCQPEAFDHGEVRLAYREGLSRFPKHLARGTEVWLNTRVVRLRLKPARSGERRGTVEVEVETGEWLAAGVVALAMPVPQATRLLESLSARVGPIAECRPLLALVHMAASATLIARYPESAPRPPWDASYPEAARSVHAIFHDSAKRGGGAALTLVIQGRPSFSARALDMGPDRWTEELLAEAADLLGGWAAEPEALQPHLWRHARVHHTSELAAPLLLALDNDAALGLCGDCFSVAAGLEGAYLSGLSLAAKIINRLVAAGDG